MKEFKLIPKVCRWIYRKIQRRRLKVTDFSIVTNTCIGGVICHELGQRFLSPMVNLTLEDVDFYKFITHLDDYLNQELRFVSGIASYPTAYLGDLLLYFVHYKTEDEARTSWNNRKGRINKDKLYIICSDRPSSNQSVTHEMMLSLKNVKCANKVIFSTRQYDDIDYIVHLPKDKDGDYVKIYMMDKYPVIKFWKWEMKWDYVKWLNEGNHN
ncbi:MAG: DUF1919 domain-containing protein [Bacteroidaceae bacterium]|nr:DUF1919 domain-containing protein [Bacteroidaceae bacterium]